MSNDDLQPAPAKPSGLGCGFFIKINLAVLTVTLAGKLLAGGGGSAELEPAVSPMVLHGPQGYSYVLMYPSIAPGNKREPWKIADGTICTYLDGPMTATTIYGDTQGVYLLDCLDGFKGYVNTIVAERY